MVVAPDQLPRSPLDGPVSALWGIGPERAGQLARLGIHSVADLLLHRPRRYEDRRNFLPIADLQLGEPAVARGKVAALGVKRFHRGQKSVFELILDDGTRHLHCRWWNLPFMEKYFEVGDEVVVYGKPISLKPRTIDHPETEVVEAGEENFIHLNRLTPIYPLTEGLPQRWLRSLMWRTLERFATSIVEPNWRLPTADSARGAGEKGRSAKSDNLARDPADVAFPSRARAIRMMHFPEKIEDVEIARQRLALEEFVELQSQMRSRRKKFEQQARALPCGGTNRLIKPFLGALGFKLTDAQTKVLREIRSDMRGAHPMRRLLQGDVGSGKTLVAACSALMAMESGYNVALMAPTEILAEQHFRNFTRWCVPLGLRVQLHTGARNGIQNRNDARTSNGDGPVNAPALFIGTHALLTQGLELPNLGLVIIDEQHRFGVAQREQLVRKGRYPHLLVMTATPIPRTLGLTFYGDLDMSIMDALPPGRGKIKTFVRTADTLPKVWKFVREKLAQGRQVYVVYPRIEETSAGIKAATKEFERLKGTLAPFQVGILHGRLRSRERDEVMDAFRSNRVQVLFATSLIEVGVDIPNATVMLIESAEQFGLAQLHQLRGRIGRGAHDSFCILISGATDEEARERLKILEETVDGFRIAEADLQLRGPGELLGREQSGAPDFRFADLRLDWDLVKLAREIVAKEGRVTT